MRYARHVEVAKRTRGVRNLFPNLVVVSLLVCVIGLTAGCGSLPSQSAGTAGSNVATVLSLSPDRATVASQEKLQFIAQISGTPNTAVTWAASAGAISSNGEFTAPKVTTNTPVIITATKAGNQVITGVGKTTVSTGGGVPNPVNPVSAGNTNVGIVSSQASATVMVTVPTAVAITTSALPAADAGAPYSTSLSATGGVAPYRWSLASGSLPSGIQLQTTSGVITGTPAITGSYPLTAKVTDASGRTAAAALNLRVSSVSTSGFDGPAELPRIYIQSAMSNTPAPGSSLSVNAGGDLQSVLNSASCGDTIQLQAGATFAGAFTFPAKSCDDTHWIVVRSNAGDSALPEEGSRLTPCYAGVSSLPGRPDFHCSSTKNVLAKLMLTTASGNGPIVFASGANHYRLMGLEITRAVGIGGITALASIVSGGTANNLIFDRVWMHGTAQDDTTRGIWLAGATYVSIVDSFLNDFHCVSATGTCGDSQAIAGGVGSGAMGPYKISGNFIEASGENILFGGDTATATPTDIELSRNHMFKPLTWMKGQAGYVGGANGNPFVVKNLLELKNAQRVLIDGNVMEDSWGGFSQVGFAIVVTPKNQSGSNGSNLCPICQVTDVTIRNTSISHVGAGLQIANALSDNGGAPLDGQRYSIHDIVVDDLDGLKYNGPSEFAQISVSAGAPLLQAVSINHVTAFPVSTLFVIGDEIATTPPMKNFIFTNSIVNAGTYPVWSTGSGSAANCAFYDVPLTTFNACFTGSVFANNAIVAPPSSASAAWPAKNFFPGSMAAIQFVNYNGGSGGDYHLQPSSPYKGKGTDRKDIGADMDAVNSAVAGVN
jgi:hypothetical protein